MLDGGLKAWNAEGHSLSSKIITRSAKLLTPAPRPELIADRDEVLASIDDDAVCPIDTLPEAFYRGGMTNYARPSNFLPDDELAAILKVDLNARTISYCGGGIISSANAFAMTRLGFTNVAVYTASLQEWAADPDNPMVVDSS